MHAYGMQSSCKYGFMAVYKEAYKTDMYVVREESLRITVG